MVYFEKKRHETSIENNNSNNIATVHIIIAAKATEKENERIICELWTCKVVKSNVKRLIIIFRFNSLALL